MSRAKKILMAGGTFSVALGIGFVMQNGDALAARFGNEPPVVSAAAVAGGGVAAVQVSAVPETTQIIDVPVAEGPALVAPLSAETTIALAIPEAASPPQPVPLPVLLAAADTDAPLTDVPFAETPAQSEVIAAPVCEPELTATVIPGAMVRLDLTAPCNPNARLTLHHQGMMFSEVTDAAGSVSVEVPALADIAVFIAAMDAGEGAVATVAVPEVAMFDRAVLLWQGDTGLSIQAREFGADYGDPGHVWAQAARTPEAALTGERGFLVRLGNAETDTPLMAEIYSFPTGLTDRAGDVILSVEAEITPQNCGRDIAAQSMQFSPASDTSATDLTLTMPGCDTVGDLLLLETMLTDLQVASR